MTTKEIKIRDVSGKIDIVINPPELTDEKNWKTVRSEQYKPDKDSFLMKRWERDWAHIPVGNIDMLYALCSRSKKAQEWLKQANLEYSATTDVPLWLNEHITNDEYIAARKTISKMSLAQSKRSAAELEAARIYDKALLNAKREYDVDIKNIAKNGYVEILNMNSTMLPMSLQLMIQNYTPAKDSHSAPSQQLYAREMLIKYKIELLKFYTEALKTNSDIDMRSVIEELSGK